MKKFAISVMLFLLTIGLTVITVKTKLLFINNTLFLMFSIFFIPLICGMVIAYFIKKHGRQIRFFIIPLVAFDILFVLFQSNIKIAAKMMAFFTGDYNLEASGFYMFFAMLFCTGMLAGLIIGSFVYKIVLNISDL
ncbi:MAG: hypothetical protein IJN62_03110 [Clostridia bacterium]|nr:hypothetical protein [Clostridia bacterium]